MQSCMPGDQLVYPVLKQLTSTPPIVTRVDELLTPAECAYLVKTAHGAGFEASEIEGRGEVRSLRTSRTADLPEDDPVVQCIERRLATIAGMPATSLEPLQATSYARGQRYNKHHDVPSDVQPDELDIAICVDRVERAFDFRVGRIETRWAGLRSFVADKCPVAGYSAEVSGFFWLAGQGGYGIQTSPALGELAAALVLGKPLPQAMVDEGVDLATLAPERLSA